MHPRPPNASCASTFFHRGFELLEAKCNETNHASRKLLEKLGFLTEAKLRGRRMDLMTGERSDLVIASITRGEAIISKQGFIADRGHSTKKTENPFVKILIELMFGKAPNVAIRRKKSK